MGDGADRIDGLKLFEVEITHTIYVLAADQADALIDATGYLEREGGEPLVHATEVKSVKYLSGDVRGSLPHGEMDDDPPTVEECVEIIARRGAAR